MINEDKYVKIGDKYYLAEDVQSVLNVRISPVQIDDEGLEESEESEEGE